MRTSRQPRSRLPAAAVVAAVTALSAAPAAAADAHYDRAFMLAADARCGLFAPPVRAALTSATLQARGAQLRGGATAVQAAETARRARARAASTPCDHPELRMVAGRVDQAFAGWLGLRRMEFPGLSAAWSVDRARFEAPRWRLSQTGVTGASSVVVGRVWGQTGLTVAVSFVGKPRPTSARIVMRDPGRFPNPWIGSRPTLAPEAQRRAVWAGATAPADKALFAGGRRGGEIWAFSERAVAELAALDPREAFAVEFVFRDGSVARAAFEVGDLAAAEAFLTLGAV
ncbi:MAG TPA: hypothetical protein VGR32_05505 [Brevundimonas sp.]|jgi:hypothetical protein|uniref:hypothetical protein n=1 Tax=Brevundimonas sp. TaxID=1871086 RepID=UPI002DE31C09|nr:hypothetical protein [Brevundimonas sp.]